LAPLQLSSQKILVGLKKNIGGAFARLTALVDEDIHGLNQECTDFVKHLGATSQL
jgi:hypothetical protein